MWLSHKVYKKVINYSDLEPFMEFVLPESNVMNIESITSDQLVLIAKDGEVETKSVYTKVK